MQSILTSIKKLLGIPEEYTVFDPDIIIHINTVLHTLNQLGIRDDSFFSISGPDETWNDFLGDSENLELVKTYVYLKVRMLFDPPQNSSVSTAMTNSISELEFRLIVAGGK